MKHELPDAEDAKVSRRTRKNFQGNFFEASLVFFRVLRVSSRPSRTVKSAFLEPVHG